MSPPNPNRHDRAFPGHPSSRNDEVRDAPAQTRSFALSADGRAMDGRDKPGHDELCLEKSRSFRTSLFALIASAAAALAIATPTIAADSVNVYSGRHYEGDIQLYQGFEKETGIRVNYIEGKSDEILQRLESEGAASPADIFITTDAGNLWRAEEKGLLQPIASETLNARVPASLRSPSSTWFALSTRARVIFYAKGRIDPASVQSYADLADPKLKGKLCVRSGAHIYNLSLLAGMIEKKGAPDAENWARGVVANLARDPQGGDIDQIQAVAAGECDVALGNSYYFVRLLKADQPDEGKIGDKVGVVFPDQAGDGTHVNISGAGVAKNAPNREAAIKFLEYLTGTEAQSYFANQNNEYPVVAEALNNPELKSLGDFKTDPINVSAYGRRQAEAQVIMDNAGWK
jgi:iron(III) transport system substrate-binding protein